MNEFTYPLMPVILTSRDYAVGSRALDEVADTGLASIDTASADNSAVTVAAAFDRVRASWAANAAAAGTGVRDVTIDGYLLVPLELPRDDRALVAIICRSHALTLAGRIAGDTSPEAMATEAFIRELLELAARLGGRA